MSVSNGVGGVDGVPAGEAVSVGDELGVFARALAGFEELDLVPDLRRPAGRPYRAALVERVLGAESLGGVRTAGGDRSGLVVVLAGLVGVLARYSGQEDVAVGCRVPEGADALSVLRVDVSDDPDFADLVSRVESALSLVVRFAGAPLEVVLPERFAECEPGRPLIGSVVVCLVDELPASPAEIDADLVVSVVRDGGGVVRVDYAVDLYSAVRMERLLEHVEVLTAGGVREPGSRLSQLPLISAAERDELLEFGRGPVRPIPDKPIHELVIEQARRAPEAVAGVFGDQRMTYGELERRSAALASYLMGLGVGPGSVVSIALERELLSLVATLGVLRSGAAYTPMDPSFPPARMRMLLDDNGARVVLTTKAVARRVPEMNGVTVLALDEQWPVIEAAPARVLPQVPVSAAAFVVYTSGSTGTPKGVVLQHDRLTNFLSWMTSECGINPDTRMLHRSSPIFDAAFGEIYATLTAGGCVVVCSRDDLLDSRRLTELINQEKVTHAFGPATNLHTIDPVDCPTMRCVIFGGEALLPDTARRWMAVGVRVVNAYGPAEIAVACTYFDAAAGWSGSVVPIGWPMPNRQVRVLDRSLGLVPVGVPGEIVIAGFGVADGYLNRPELTTQRFVTDPYSGTLAYRSGDLGRWNASGALEILGRMDHQVKVNGIRIELGEIESVLAQHDDVDGAVVVRREDQGVARLVAYVTGREGRQPSVSALREHASTFLPPFMVPAVFVVLDRFPVGATGKINRSALPAPDQHRPELDVAYQAPETTEEKLVAEVFAEVLGIEDVGALDSFFELGGTSLTAATAATKIDKVAEAVVPVSQIHRTPTVRELARWLAQAPRRATVEPTPNDVSPTPGPIPLTPAAAKCLTSPKEVVVPLTWWIEGDLDIGALMAAMGDVHRRHQALHARYRRTDPPAAVVPVNPGMPQLRLLADASDEQSALDQLAEAVQQPLDFTQGWIWRAALIRETSSGRVAFGVGVHHIAFDGWSQALLVQDLSHAYAARRAGRAPQWDRPAPTLGEVYAEWERLQAATDLAAQRAYWREQLRGLPPQGGSRDVPLDQMLAWGPKTGHIVPLSSELIQRWDQAARTHRFSRSSYFAAAFASALREIHRQDDIAFLMPVAKRGSRILDGALTIRLVSNCVRVRFRSDESAVHTVHRTIEDLMRASDVPFHEVANDPANGLDAGVIATLPMFVYQDNIVAPLELPGCRTQDVIEPYAREVMNGLAVEAVPGDGDAFLRITIRTDQLPMSFAEELGDRMLRFLEGMPQSLLVSV